jgi:hypothetical protein
VTHDGACGEVKANMSLGLHADCQKRLIEKIGDLLGEVKVINGNSLDVDSFMGFFELDSVFPTPVRHEISWTNTLAKHLLLDSCLTRWRTS